MKKLYVTTPLYYVNAKPHIGHSYTEIACDTVARFMRQAGCEVFFMTGTDEHGEKIERAVIEAGLKQGDEKQFVDGIVPHFKELWRRLGIQYDYFIRTTDELHESTVKKVLEILFEKGKICKKAYRGWFCTPCEMFWTDTQAEKGICPDCKRPLERLDEENYFLKLSEYQDALITHIRDNPSFILPDIRRNEVLSFLKHNELQDLCISRPKTRLRWGIELPFDGNFVTYVWLDALINYISGIGYLNDKERFRNLWPYAYHVIGKDILRHHAIYWPILLMALDEKPPAHIFAHGWWVVGGEKMSKSKGNIVDPMEMIDKYGVEPFRYYLLSAVTFGADGVFSEELFVKKYNADLANDLGNLLNRTLTMIEKYFGGILPRQTASGTDDRLRKATADLPAEVAGNFKGNDFSAALSAIWSIIGRANKYIEEKAPWKLAKTGEHDALKEVIYNLAQALGAIAVSLYSFMPETSRSIWGQLGMDSKIETLTFQALTEAARSAEIIPPGTAVRKMKPLFPRIET